MKSSKISEGDLVVIRSFSREDGFDTEEDYETKRLMVNKIFKIAAVLEPNPRDLYTYEIQPGDWTIVYFLEEELELAFTI